MNSKTLKGFTVGAVAGIVSMLIGMGAAKAECSQDFSTYELAFDLAEVRCDAWSQGMLEDEGMTEDQLGGAGGMYEACMRLSVPPMVLSPAQHYDTTDGAFWKSGGAL